MSLEGKYILITGAARRVGRELALAVARAGGNVVIHYGQSQDEAQSLSDEIRALGSQAYTIRGDLADPAQVSKIIPMALEHGPLFGLVNNAAIFKTQSWQDTSLEDWNQHLMVNLTAPFLLSQAFSRQLPQGSTGRIVNLLDWRALRPGADHLPYTISKSALAALTHSLAIALAPNISVNGLALGAILPPSEGQAPANLLKNVPAGRWAELREVGEALVFLLDGPAYITGEIIHIDGGRHLI
ncbi:MAG TPA: SDR family oxidoreductase [Anaerolineales bacterium]|nr:SDR family oxidoreductase [Anaerolineales bacterium]